VSFERGAGVVAIAVDPLLALDHVALGHGDVDAVEQRELLGFGVGDGGAPLEGVEVIVGEGLLRHLLTRLGDERRLVGEITARARRGSVQVAGHQLQAGPRERGAGVVSQRHPAVEVGAGGRFLAPAGRYPIVFGTVTETIPQMAAPAMYATAAISRFVTVTVPKTNGQG
jgi:hypothetical protein